MNRWIDKSINRSVDHSIRLSSIDALRGLVMVIMALDHTREFFHAGAMTFQPEDLAKTTPAIFLTRWVTHICAPTFMFLAGLGAWMRLERDGSKARLSAFLASRGLWLILVELTVMRLALNFTTSSSYPVFLIILWAIGWSMIALAALVHLPVRAVTALSLAIILLHNLLDPLRPAQFGAFSGVWTLLHQQGVLSAGGLIFIVGYPVLPWIGVMGAGFAFGRVMSLPADRRERVMLLTGVACIAVFLILRAVNVYGDPRPWSTQPQLVMTLLSFLRATKNPASLIFVLMTLGPALVLLARFDRRPLAPNHPLVIIGRVPFFYFVVHFWLLHVAASTFAWLRYGGASFDFLFSPLPSMGGDAARFPSGFGYPLWAVYVFWIAVVALMYPLCKWFARVKQRGSWWVSYL